MLKIRKGIFETNSSSSHSFSIGKISVEQSIVDLVPGTIVLGGGEYWGYGDYTHWQDKADYIAVLLGWDGYEILKKIINKKFPNMIISYTDSGYVDDGPICDWMRKEDELFKFIFGDGEVSIRSDN